MSNILIYQPYLSNRKLSSGTLERQFRFLKYKPDTIYALLDVSEAAYAEVLKSYGWVTPIVMQDLCDNVVENIKFLQDKYNFTDIYIARTYFTPCTKEQKQHLKDFQFPADDDRYWRDYIPVEFSKLGAFIHHIVYDPLELNYIDIIPSEKYKMYSSMNNVDNAEPHDFADLGYYDVNKEVTDKLYDFTFGATAVEPDRAKLILSIYESLKSNKNCNMFVRALDIDTLVDNSTYEKLTSESMFTYTIPSYDPKYMSFTRMLLALAQGTIPLIHPSNNLDCLFGEGFEFREDLESFFRKLIVAPEDLPDFLSKDNLKDTYKLLLEDWHNTEYFKLLQEL